MATTIETVDDLRGPAGRLEALLNPGEDDAEMSALVCHPHPPSGGTMHNKVVFHAMKALQGFGLPVLRFNFRGTGLSEGVHDGGAGEIEDARAAIDWLSRRYSRPVLLAGFSFGANVGFRAACGDPRVCGLIGLGMPMEAGGRRYHYEFLRNCTQPKLFVTGLEDPFAPRTLMEEVLKSAPPPSEMVWIVGAEHFFAGVPASPKPKLPEMGAAIQRWLAVHFRPQRRGSTPV